MVRRPCVVKNVHTSTFEVIEHLRASIGFYSPETPQMGTPSDILDMLDSYPDYYLSFSIVV